MLGTGDFALPTFERLIGAGYDVAALVTQPDRPQGRKQELVPSRIKLAALERSVPVEQPEDVNAPEPVALLRTLCPDLLVTAAYGQILSAELLGVAPLSGINLHGSILPAYRGAAPVARAIQHGESETGVTVILMSPRVDAGGMLAFARTPIGPDETAGELEDRLAHIGAPLVLQVIKDLTAGATRPIPQQKAKVTKAPKLHKDDGRIEWTRTAQQVHDLVRAMQPWPTASTYWHTSEVSKAPLRLIVHKTALVEGQGPPGRVLEAQADRLIVAASQGAVRVVSVQVPGKKAMGVADFLRGHLVLNGDLLGEL
jgi:methionyl-tRNA formyltransferase